MQKSAHFRVDPKLAHVLGESYTSSEKALKELVDNAVQSEKEEGKMKKYKTTSPSATSSIIIPTSSFKSRIVKGRKGTGKFAGLILASEMELATQAAGKRTTTALQALALRNNEWMLLQAENFAESIQGETNSPETAVRRAFARALLRAPSPGELAAGLQLASQQGLMVLCRMFINANEFVYLD